MSETLMNIGNRMLAKRKAAASASPSLVSARVVGSRRRAAARGGCRRVTDRGLTSSRLLARRRGDCGGVRRGGFRTGGPRRALGGRITRCAVSQWRFIISGGFTSIREIEEVLLECAGVREAAVIGVPDPHAVRFRGVCRGRRGLP